MAELFGHFFSLPKKTSWGQKQKKKHEMTENYANLPQTFAMIMLFKGWIMNVSDQWPTIWFFFTVVRLHTSCKEVDVIARGTI